MRYTPTTNAAIMISAILAIIAIITPSAHAELALDSIQFDPAIISSGDTVDIVAQFHETGIVTAQSHLGDPAYRFKITLEQDDTISREYTSLEDAEGQDLQGIITRGGYYNKRFRIKVNDNAPAGSYGFRLTGQWIHNGNPTGSEQYLRFTMPVKKQGIALSIANVVSNPEKVRSGDKNILLTTTITNTGEKTAKNVRIKLDYPDGISSSYTNNNDLSLGSIGAGQERPVQLYIDTDRAIKAGLYDIAYTLTYQDTDNNEYTSNSAFPFVIKKRPDITITESKGEGTAGDTITMRVTVKNQGEETADAVDVRILKQSSQPFEMDVRSDYLGQLRPGETGTAIFTIKASDDAEAKLHRLNVIIRAKGDSSEGDENIYTFTESAAIEITGPAPNHYPFYAGAFLVAVIIAATIMGMAKRKKEKKR